MHSDHATISWKRTMLGSVRGYALAIASVAGATWTTIRIQPLMGESISPLFFAAVMVSAWYGGWGPGLVATALAGWASAYYFLDNPPGQGAFGWDDWIRLGVFIMVAVLISSLTSLRKRAERLLKESHDELERRVQVRTSELRSANEKLIESEERFRLLVEGVSDYAVVMLDAEGRVASWNTGAGRILGYAQDEIIERHVSTFFNTDPQIARLQLETADKQGRHEDEGWRRRKDGSQLWASVITTALRGGSGQLRGFAQVTRDITELRNLEREVLEISEAEQRRIGHDLHDGLGQELTGLAFLTQNLQRQLEATGIPLAGEAGRILSLTNRAIDQVRTLARGFSPVELGPDGLKAGLREFARRIQEVFGLPCEFVSQSDVRIFDDAAALPLYRIAQEAVNNALRHAKPRHIRIGLETLGKDVCLTVEDDGLGVEKSQGSQGGMGIRVMHYRARMIDAQFEIQSPENGGTLIICRHPNPLPSQVVVSHLESNGQEESNGKYQSNTALVADPAAIGEWKVSHTAGG